MAIAQYIRQHGFRRWYERELVRGHAHLLLLLLCALAVMGAIEAFGQQRGDQRLLMVLSLVVATVLGLVAMRRYLFHLGRAEALAHQAACPHCHAYARWQVDGPADEKPEGLCMPVCCRACGGRWTIRW